MWNGRTNTYTVLDELHVFEYDEIYNDFYGTPGAFVDKLMTIRSKDLVYLGSLCDSLNKLVMVIPQGGVLGEYVPFCFTDGNATKSISRFYNNLQALDELDWTTIKSTLWKNTDDDYDRVRKKMAI